MTPQQCPDCAGYGYVDWSPCTTCSARGTVYDDIPDFLQAALNIGAVISRADEVPPGSCCGFCSMQRHLFIHPHMIPGSLWWLEDGCPCCETHVGERVLWRHDPPLGTAPRLTRKALDALDRKP